MKVEWGEIALSNLTGSPYKRMASTIVHQLLALSRRLLLWLALLVLLAVGWVFWSKDVLVQYWENRNDRNALKKEVERLERDVERREHEREMLKQGGFETEKVARENLKLIKPGEEVLYLQPPPSLPPGEKGASPAPEKSFQKSPQSAWSETP